MRISCAALVCLLLATHAEVRAADDPWRVPPPDSCRSEPPRLLVPRKDLDAPPIELPKPGETIGFEQAERLRELLPPEIWEKRERFFFDGMQMEIGPCYRDYSPPEFFLKATRELHEGVTLGADGKLSGARAGLPFPPTFGPSDSQAGLRWAWNMVYRYQGAGHFGRHQISLVNERGVAEQWRGDHFFVQIRGRADRAADDYVYPAKTAAGWAAGGTTTSVQTGKDCVFRQYENGGRKPEFFMGSSYSRKMSRASDSESEFPLTGCLTDAAIGAGLFLHGGEPSLYEWKVRAVADLLAPINAAKNTWPVDAERGYGPWGISFADDRWELRRVLVLEGRLREGKLEDGTSHFVWYLDLQTLTPLYYAGFKTNGDAAGIGYFVGRWSEDRTDYPRWHDDPDRPMRVLDPIGGAFVDWNQQHAVREDTGADVAVPESDDKLRRSISVGSVRLR